LDEFTLGSIQSGVGPALPARTSREESILEAKVAQTFSLPSLSKPLRSIPLSAAKAAAFPQHASHRIEGSPRSASLEENHPAKKSGDWASSILSNASLAASRKNDQPAILNTLFDGAFAGDSPPLEELSADLAARGVEAKIGFVPPYGDDPVLILTGGNSLAGEFAKIARRRGNTVAFAPDLPDGGQFSMLGGVPTILLSKNAVFEMLERDDNEIALHELKHSSVKHDDYIRFSQEIAEGLPVQSRYLEQLGFARSEMLAWQVSAAASAKRLRSAKHDFFILQARSKLLDTLSSLRDVSQLVEYFYSSAYAGLLSKKAEVKSSGNNILVKSQGIDLSIHKQAGDSNGGSSKTSRKQREELMRHILSTVRRARNVGARTELQIELLEQDAPERLWKMFRDAGEGLLQEKLKEASLSEWAFKDLNPTAFTARRLLVEIFFSDRDRDEAPMIVRHRGSFDYFNRKTGRGVRIDSSTGSILSFISLKESEQKDLLKKQFRTASLWSYKANMQMLLDSLSGYDAREELKNLVSRIPKKRLSAALASAVKNYPLFKDFPWTEDQALFLMRNVFYDLKTGQGAIRIESPEGVEYQNRHTGLGVVFTPQMDGIRSFVWRWPPQRPIEDARSRRWKDRLDALQVPD